MPHRDRRSEESDLRRDAAGGNASDVASGSRQRARILIVDDDERNLFAMEEVLADIGEVVATRSGKEALKRLLEHDFAVILLDVLMPGMDGYETAALIRRRDRSRHVPIIFLTAVNKDDAHMLRGYAMGAVDYVFKPVEPLILRSKVSVFVDLFNKTQEVQRKAEQEQKLLADNFRVRTEKFEAERALRRSEERQAMIVRSLPIILYAGEVGHQRGSLQFLSDSVGGICGFTAPEFQNAPDLWSSRLHPEDRDRVIDAFARLETTGALAIEYRWRRADDQYRYFLDQAVLVRDERGTPKEIFGTILDVSERRRLEQQLLQAQKMEAIGKLTGGIAHDFNNMLTVVIGSLDRLKRMYKEDAAALKRVGLALEGALRCGDLTRQLLAFARRQTLQPHAIDLEGLVAGVADMVRRILGETIVLEIEGEPGQWAVQADPTQVESAVLNLVVNARDAMPDGGTMRVTTRNVRVDEAHALRDAGLAPGDYVALTVADTGAGIPPEIRDRIFEPFFTTKELGRGTGLGLSIIYGFVKQSGGHITLESEVGRGTSITIYLPRAAGGAEAIRSVRADGKSVLPRARDGEIVLLVEDDKAVREVAATTLEDLGYEVLEAENGPGALEILTRMDRIDLLFTDLAMPGGMSGSDLAREAAKRKNGVKVLLTSAYAERLAAEANATIPMRLLNKPYREPDLAHAVRGAIDDS